MKLFFIDESKKQQNKRKKLFFAQLGLMVDVVQVLSLEKEIIKLKKRYSVESLKDLRKRVSPDIKLQSTKALYGLLNKHKVKLLAAVLGSRYLEAQQHMENAYFDGLFFLTERFFIHLRKEDKVGLIVHDQIDGVESNLRKQMYSHITEQYFTMYGDLIEPFLDRIYPSIFFAKDDFSHILQVTDLIATAFQNAIWEMMKKNKSIDANRFCDYNKYLKIYWPLFVKNNQSNVDGWGIKVWW